MTKKELEERLNWYREQWEKCIKEDIKNTDKFLEFAKKMQSIIEENQSLSDHNKIMISLLTIYSKWDPYIIEMMKSQGLTPPVEGPATLYLKEIGAFTNERNRGN